MRLLAATTAACVLLATMGLALRWGGRIEAVATGVLVATVGSSPYLESFTLCGELVASLPSVLALVAFTGYLRRRQPHFLVLTGLLTGCAVMVKQSAFDGGLAAVAFLLVTRRRGGIGAASAVVACALVPVAVAAGTAPRFADWWHAVVGYRARDDSLLTGGPVHHLYLLAVSLPAAAIGLSVLVLLAGAGWSRAPLLARIWLLAALPGVIWGGNFHPHYYLQLVPPLAVLGGLGARRLLVERRLTYIAVVATAVAATAALTVPLWFASGSTQARFIWHRDPHLRHQAALAEYLRAHTRPTQSVYVVWAAADVYYLADRDPAVPYIWYRNVEAVPGALALVRRTLAERKPALVLEVEPAVKLDRSGRTAAILERDYRLAALVDGTPVLTPKPG